MIAEQFLNPMPRQMNAHQGMAPNMMMPYYPMNHNNMGGVFNNCSADMGEMVTAPQKKKNKRKKKRYYYSSSSSNDSDDSSSDEESKKKNKKKRSKKKDS